MKKTNKMVRSFSSVILALVLILGMTASAFAGWETYNGGISSNGVYLQETWYGNKQCINFWKNGQWLRNVAGEGHTLWINDVPILYNLYGTQHWCYDQYGNCFAIDNNKRLLLCRINTTSFVINNSVAGCTGFQRDGNKVGYMLYTDYGQYNLSDLLNGTTGNTNYGTTITSNAPYSYDDIVTQKGDLYYYNYKGKEYSYNILGNKFYCGTTLIEYDVDRFGFSYGYVIYVVNSKPSVVYRLPIGKTSEAKQIGRKFEGFNYDSSGWITSVQLEGKTVNVNNNYSNSSNNNNYNYDYDYVYDYPYVKISGEHYYYYTSKSKCYIYYLKKSSLYYKGTNNTSINTLISNYVDDITFCNGYIVYALSSGKVYKHRHGSLSSKEQIGTKFDYFDGEDYMSEGYYDTNGRYISFDGRYDTDEDYPYVEKSGSYYYYYKSNTKTYEYCLKNSKLYYNDEVLETSVKDITFSKKGYVVCATKSGYVYAYPIGKTSSSYRNYIGRDFDYFDDDDYMSDGYYDEYDDYVYFDF